MWGGNCPLLPSTEVCDTLNITEERYYSGVSDESLSLPGEEGVVMQPVNVYQFYQLGMQLHPLSTLEEGQPLNTWRYRLYMVQTWLDFILGDRLVPLGVAWPAGNTLLHQISQLLKRAEAQSEQKPDQSNEPQDSQVEFSEAYSIKNALTTFETVFSAQMQGLATYFVSRKLGYETALLIEEAEQLIPESIRKEIPEAIPDLQQAGKCIAFDIPTAAGFHIVRATEAVIRKYYAAVVGKPPKKQMRNWGAYIKNLNAAGADAKVTGFLDHIRESYRNPVLHPEDTLTPQDAQVLLGVCVSAIVAMVQAMKSLPAKPTAALAATAAKP